MEYDASSSCPLGKGNPTGNGLTRKPLGVDLDELPLCRMEGFQCQLEMRIAFAGTYAGG